MHTDFLDSARGRRERAERVSALLKSHFAATMDLEGDLKAGLEERGKDKEMAGQGTDIRSIKKQKVLVVEGVAEVSGGLADNQTPFKLTSPLLPKNDSARTMYNTKDIASYFVRKC